MPSPFALVLSRSEGLEVDGSPIAAPDISHNYNYNSISAASYATLACRSSIRRSSGLLMSQPRVLGALRASHCFISDTSRARPLVGWGIHVPGLTCMRAGPRRMVWGRKVVSAPGSSSAGLPLSGCPGLSRCTCRASGAPMGTPVLKSCQGLWQGTRISGGPRWAVHCIRIASLCVAVRVASRGSFPLFFFPGCCHVLHGHAVRQP